jgi:hypothetical protein
MVDSVGDFKGGGLNGEISVLKGVESRRDTETPARRDRLLRWTQRRGLSFAIIARDRDPRRLF